MGEIVHSTNQWSTELQARAIFVLNKGRTVCCSASSLAVSSENMSTKENNSEVAVDKVTENNDKPAGDAKAEVKGTKRPAEVSK